MLRADMGTEKVDQVNWIIGRPFAGALLVPTSGLVMWLHISR